MYGSAMIIDPGSGYWKLSSVAYPDVFGPPGSGSFHHQAKK